MVLRLRYAILPGLLLTASLGGAQEGPSSGEVVLPLKDYLTLVETAERVEREQTRRAALAEAPVAEVVEQKTSLILGENEAEVTSTFSVLVHGVPKSSILLPFAGFAAEAEVKALDGTGNGGAAVTTAKSKGWWLVTPAPGRYAVRMTGRVALHKAGGISRLEMPPLLAPVAWTEVNLPADLAWSAPGAVVVEDRVDGGRRTVRLATPQGQVQPLEVRRRVDSGEAEKLLARTAVLTMVQLGPEGPRRHDVVLYDVARGSLGSFTVDLPTGLVVEQAGTDEGIVVPVVEARRLTVHRRKQLAGTGYLVLSSTPEPEAELPLVPVTPQAEPRARYLAVSSSVAADLRPLPEASWSRVDLDDLPQLLREALAELDLSAAWRLAGKPGTETALAISVLPPARSLDTVVRLRETTTLLTVDGTVLHRDRFTLRSGSGAGTALDLVLPATATLWSAQVNGLPVRPVERGGTVSVPLGFENRGEPVVEVVSVLERAIPPGRSQLALSLPQLAPPVLEHRWRLLLPESTKYRYRSGDLRPAREVPSIPTAQDPWQVLQRTPGVLTDRINVGGQESGQQAGTVTAESPQLDERAKAVEPPPQPPPPPSAYYDLDAFEEMRQGLVGGVKPLPIRIPESGKVLLLTGVLPPAQVSVELDVRAKK